jgi:hypothetical protein
MRVQDSPSKLAASLTNYEVVHVEFENGMHALSIGYHHTLNVAFMSKGQKVKVELRRHDELFHPKYEF